MFKARNIVLGLISLGALMTAASAQAGATPFMPRGEGVGAPVGFADLCRRDLNTCGVPASQLALLGVEAPTALAPTASLGGAAGQRHFPAAAASASIDDEAEAKLISVETVEAFVMAPVEDFVPAGQPRPATPAVAAPGAPFAWASRAERDQLKLLNQINQSVNREVRKASDLEIYGVEEYWSLPRVINGKKYGDCEDYALEKRRQLIEAGVPASALSLAVAVTARGESHAVLMISLKSGDWVLDNLTPWATPWQDLNYHWVERQVPGTALWTAA